ncbi:glycerate kinase type-2 family protein [Roseinatronobacter sp.]
MLTRAQMIELFKTGVGAADPRAAVHNALTRTPLDVPTGGRVYALAIGKAAHAMMSAALPLLPKPDAAIVVTNYENAAPLEGARVMAAGHPVPDENGMQAGLAIQKMLARTRSNDVVLVLVSGGGSALVPAPVSGVSLSDKAQVNDLLLGAGLDIGTMNAVRQHLSRMKGGGLLRMAAPAQVQALILSDVIGDDLRAIASGPTVAPIATRDEVRALLATSGLWERLPPAARDALTREGDTPPLPDAQNRLIGSNQISLAAMARDCDGAKIVSDKLIGDVGAAAEEIVQIVREGSGPRVALFGGETTVRLTGTGRGGRNQELALRVATALDGVAGWRFLSGGTDGRDGPTDVAGAVVDGDTLARIRAANGDPAALLADNDSYHALQLADDLLVTGATGTNVADLQILCIDA